jgi:uncharacterized membrane protein (DUF106 family)
MMMMIFASMFVMFIPELRNGVGAMAGVVLEPIIGFNGHLPIVTVLLAGIVLVAFSSAVRHYFIDWVDSAEKQFRMKDFNKKLRDARMSGDETETRRLTEKQLQMSTDQMMSTFDQMKPMMFTMIFLIATFAFIGTFIEGIPGATLSVPWSGNVDMNASLSSNACCAFTNWMLLYMLISMSVSQIFARVFKLYSFNRILRDPEAYLAKVAQKAESAGAAQPAIEEPEDLQAGDDDEYLEIDDAGDSDGMEEGKER